MKCGYVKTGCLGVMPHDWPMNTGREKLSELLDGGIGLSVEDMLSALSGLPFLDGICFESKATRIGYIRLAQILHANFDGRLAVG